MATRGIVHSPVDKQIVSQELRAAYGLEYLKRLAADALAAFYSVPCALGTQWTVTANANGVKVAIPALRQAVVSDASGRMRLLQATAALPEGMDVFTPIPNAECYIGLRFEEVPYRASQLGAPTVSGGVAPFAFDLVQERIGLTNVPDSVDLGTPDHTILDVTTLFEGPWTSATYTRTIVAWLVNPVTGGAEAIWTGTAALVGGAIVADVPHRFGQSSASGTASDYAVCLLGPIITTDPEILTDPTICPLAHITGSTTVDMSVQPVESTASQIDPRLDALDAFVRGYQYGPAQPYRPGAMLGSNGDMGWNNITLTEPGGGVVKAAFPFSPFDGITGAWLFVDGHYLHETAADAPDWTDYQFSPGAGAGTKTICIEAVDETTGATPKWTARLMTYSGTYGNALLAGLLPLVTYQWTGAAIDGGGTMQTALRLRAIRGERQHRDAGGPVLYLAPETLASGLGSLALRSGPESASKGVEQLCLLGADDDDTAGAMVAFERFKAILDTKPGYIEKVAAQANAAVQTTDAEFSALQLGGAGDLAVVGRTVGGVRQIAIAPIANPLTKELLVFAEDGGKGDVQIPAGSLKYPIVLAGDHGYLGGKGKINSRRVPLANVGDGWRTRISATPADVLGPWLYGSLLTGAAPTLADAGNWWWLLVDGSTGLTGANVEKALYIEIAPRYREYFTDCDILASNGNYGGDAVLTWSVVRIDDAGNETVWVVSKGGAGNDWLTNDVAEYRRPSEHGKPGAAHPNAGAVAWVADTHLFHMEIGYRWFVKFTPSVVTTWNRISARGVIVHMRRYEA